MAGENLSLVDLIKSLPDGPGWGPPVTSETMLNGVPYAPYSKGDKLGKMADWTSDSKDGRDGRGGRNQYGRNYRGAFFCVFSLLHCSMFTNFPRPASVRRRLGFALRRSCG